VEDLTSARCVDNVHAVDRYSVFFNHLRATALSFEDSATLIMSVIRDSYPTGVSPARWAAAQCAAR
jgi:hypothetical protein